jgi:4-diphosphocytidyl-2-C-methyl-D-erythritol kinase
MGGGSADAAAMLRRAPRLSPVRDDVLARIAVSLGADVPAQLRPGPSLGTGGGEILAPLPEPEPYGVLVLSQPFELATRDVYREADRLGLARSGEELAQLAAQLAARLPERLVNDLEPATLSLAPAIGIAIGAARGAGADDAIVCGSGPTVIGVFRGMDGERRARRAAEDLGGLAAAPVRAGVGASAPND